MNTLKNVKVGDTVKVVKLHGEGPVKRRIMDMGITKGVEIYVRKVASKLTTAGGGGKEPPSSLGRSLPVRPFPNRLFFSHTVSLG